MSKDTSPQDRREPSEPPSTPLGVPKTRDQFAAALGISYHTLRRRILAAGLAVPERQLLSPRQQAEIRAALGYD